MLEEKPNWQVGLLLYLSLSVVNSYSQDVEKRPRRIPKNKRMPAEPPKERLSTFSIRYIQYVHAHAHTHTRAPTRIHTYVRTYIPVKP